MTQKERAQKAVKILFDPKRPLTGIKGWKTPWQFLLCVIMSARTTDDQVNIISPKLFKKFPALEDFAQASPTQVQPLIKSIGFFRTKANYLTKAARVILEDYKGKVPGTIEELIKIPGVGRKTANVFQGVILGKSEGIAVDTHVARMSRRLKLTNQSSADKIEKDLIKLYLKTQYYKVNPSFFWQGREICIAKKPKCEECKINYFCPSSHV